MDIFLVALVSFLFRFIFLLSATSDDHVHFWNIKLRQKIGNPWGHQVPDSLIKGKRGYPALTHYIVSLFPSSYWGMAGRLLNIVYDCVSVIMVYHLTRILFEMYFNTAPVDTIVTPDISVALLVATSPILMPVTSRMSSFGGRSFCLLLSLLYFSFLGYGLLYNVFCGVIVCVPIGILIVMSSQFAFQNLIFLSLILGVMYVNPLPILMLVLMAIVCWFVPQLGIRDILRFKYEHMKWYRRNYAKGTTASNRNKLSDVLCLPLYLVTNLNKFVQVIFYRSSYIIAMYSVPPLVFSGLILLRFNNLDEIFGNPLIRYVSFVVIGSVFVFFLTSMKPFLYLGQAERYFEYSVPFIAFLFVFLVFKRNLPGALIYYTVLLQIIFVLMNFLVVNSGFIKSRLLDVEDPELYEVLHLLKGFQNLKILTIPTKMAFRISYYFDGEHKFYYRSINEVGKGFRYLDEDWKWFELPKPNMRYFKKKYGVDTVVVEKQVVDEAGKLGVYYDFEGLEKILENNKYVVFRS